MSEKFFSFPILKMATDNGLSDANFKELSRTISVIKKDTKIEEVIRY